MKIVVQMGGPSVGLSVPSGPLAPFRVRRAKLGRWPRETASLTRDAPRPSRPRSTTRRVGRTTSVVTGAGRASRTGGGRSARGTVKAASGARTTTADAMARGRSGKKKASRATTRRTAAATVNTMAEVTSPPSAGTWDGVPPGEEVQPVQTGRERHGSEHEGREPREVGQGRMEPPRADTHQTSEECQCSQRRGRPAKPMGAKRLVARAGRSAERERPGLR